MELLPPFSCTLCKVYLHSFDRLQWHKRIHKTKYVRLQTTREYVYRRCRFCEMYIGGFRSLQIHIRTVHRKSRPCQSFANKNLPNNEARKHPSTNCPKSLITKPTRIDAKKKTHWCEPCQESFSHAGSLRKHFRTQTKEKPYTCKKCFAQKGNLKDHVRTNTKEKPYQCDFCKKCFTQKSKSRHTHKHSHSRETVHCFVSV